MFLAHLLKNIIVFQGIYLKKFQTHKPLAKLIKWTSICAPLIFTNVCQWETFQTGSCMLETSPHFLNTFIAEKVSLCITYTSLVPV